MRILSVTLLTSCALTSTAFANNFVSDLLNHNAGSFTGKQADSDKPCSLEIYEQNGEFSLQFKYFDEAKKETQTFSIEENKFNSNGELPFIQATNGFLFKAVNYGIAWSSDYRLDRFWVSNWNQEFARCDFDTYTNLEGRTYSRVRKP